MLPWMLGGGQLSPNFRGNPNATITSIGGSIAAPRVSGATPYFAHVSASGITCAGTRADGTAAIPYEDLEFVWTSDDATGAQDFTIPIDNLGNTRTFNSNSQRGPEAVFRFTTAGTKTITLTATGKNGVLATSAKFTKVITVSAYAATREMWFDSVNGSDSNNGLTSGAPKQTLAAIQAFITPYGAGASVAAHLAQGSTWTSSSSSAAIGIPNSDGAGGPVKHFRMDNFVGAGGAGANPLITVTGSGQALAFGNSGGGSTDHGDIVITGIDFTNSVGASSSILVGQITGGAASVNTVEDIYLNNCNVINTLNINGMIPFNMHYAVPGTVAVGFGVWGGSASGPIFANGVSLTKHSIFGGPDNWWFVIGTSLSGSGAQNSLDHHIYPEPKTHSLYQWITFGATGTGTAQRNYAINTNHDTDGNAGPPDFTEFYAFVENSAVNVANVQHWHDLGNNLNDPSTMQYRNVVDQGNYIGNVTSILWLFSNGASNTIRDNYLWNNGALFVQQGPNQPVIDLSGYRNKIYSANGAIDYSPVLYTATFNNGFALINYPNAFLPLGSKIRLTTTGALPTNFAVATDYYIVTIAKQITITNGSPASITNTITSSTNSLVVNDEVTLGTTGVLPTDGATGLALVAGQPYFVVNVNAGTGAVQIASTMGGSAINTSGGSGQAYFTSQAPGHGSVAGFPSQPTSNSFPGAIMLAATPNGTPIVAGSAGSGTQTIKPIMPLSQSWTDNIFQAPIGTSSVSFFTGVWADLVANASLFDRNSYYAPGVSGWPATSAQIMKDTATAKTFAQWQSSGFDIHGTQLSSSPFADPANGGF